MWCRCQGYVDLFFRLETSKTDIVRLASADRRPVDPPPIIELHILEGDNENDLRDITFHMDAGYFLFTTLEHARPMAPCVDSRTPTAYAF